MSITDELREYISKHEAPCLGMSMAAYMRGIADRIDAEHEEAIQQALMGEGGVPATDENMAEHGWIRLPKDADDVPICIGDVMDFKKNVCGLTVLGIGTAYADEFPSYGVFVREDNEYVWYNAEFLHHHVPTVEDVLTEMFAKAIERGELTNGAAQTIAEYAKRLTLAEVEDA